MSNDFKMNGPAEFNMEVYVANDETGQSGKVTVGLGAFEYPTPAKIEAKMKEIIDELEEKGMVGFRLMDKHETFEQWSIENLGERMAIASGPEWDEIQYD